MEPALVVLIAVGAAPAALALSVFVGHLLALLVEDDERPFVEIEPRYPEGVVSLLICPHCGYENVENSVVCQNCARPLTGLVCPRCGHENPGNYVVCDKCAARLTPTPTSQVVLLCPRCGHDNPATRLSCDKCGALLSPTPASQAADAPSRRPAGPRYADWWMRWLGYSIIDGLVVAGLGFLLGIILFAMFYASNEYPTTEEENTFTGFVTLFAYAAAFVYFWVSNSVGRSVGKVILGLRVVIKDTGEAPGPARGFLRTFGYLVSTVPLALGFLWAAWDEDRQAWHDKMAGTVVVSTR